MARVSRKSGEALFSPPKSSTLWSTAIYLRLSVEDNGRRESDSIENQRQQLLEYVAQALELELAEIYEDNGFTGTDFERPAFQRMISDIRSGKVSCVVVKDLSRLGRNYVEAGNYLEKVFPFLGVRFIAVNDHFDSLTYRSGDQLTAALKNLINDIYAKDISRKAGVVLKEKRRKGEYIGNYAPYGYLKDSQDKNRLVVDEEIAPVVQEIFQMRAAGMGFGAILRELNRRDIPSPGRLRYERGVHTNNNQKGEQLLWGRHVLRDLLSNVAYIGHLAQGKNVSALYKGIPLHTARPEEWDCAVFTHEPIITMELWNQVQEINQRQAQKAKGSHGKYQDIPKRENPYGDLLRCGHCGRVMKQLCSYDTGRTRRYYTYKCSLREEAGERACACPPIRAAELDQAVLGVIRKQMDAFLDAHQVLQQLTAAALSPARKRETVSRLARLRREIARIQKKNAAHYQDYKEGLLTKEEYLFGKDAYQEEVNQLEQEIGKMENRQNEISETEALERKWLGLLDRHQNREIVTEEMVRDFVVAISVQEDGSLSITFKYRNEFEEVLRRCDVLRKEVA